jgi:DNA-binding transcriptional regulator GbsR (MarR family)
MKKERIKVEDHNDFVRDSSTNAIINTDVKSYRQYMKKINTQRQTKEDIRDLQNEMSEIKELLIKILEKK